MWAPHPRGRVIRRPQPDFSHRVTRIKKRTAPRAHPNPGPDPRCNYKYFGIHRTDVTEYLKHVVPSHAFHPSLIGAPPPPARGRHPVHLRGIDERRPETAPAASTAWFGRTCSDVSDWLRYRPPAHLGLDPDNKPLPYYPTSSSIVTDSKWQTREYPELPHVLWHWWAERPSSVPLATNPQHVKFDSLLSALKNKSIRVKPPGVHSTIPHDIFQEEESAQTSRSTSRAQTPRPGGFGGFDQLGERENVNRAERATPRGRVQTPRGVDSGVIPPPPARTSPNMKYDQGTREDAAKSPGKRNAVFRSGESTPRPTSAPCETQPGIDVVHNGGVSQTPRARISLSNAETSPRPPSAPRPHSVAGEHPTRQESKPLGLCNCIPRAGPGSRPGSCTPRGATPAPTPAPSPRDGNYLKGTSMFGAPSRSGFDLQQQVEAKRCRCNLQYAKQEAAVAAHGGQEEAPKTNGSMKGNTNHIRKRERPPGPSQNDPEALTCTGSRLSNPGSQSGHAGGGTPREDLPCRCTCRQKESKSMACPSCAQSHPQEGYRAATPMKSSKPPPSPRVTHGCPVHEHQFRQAPPERHPAALPPRLFVQGQGQVPERKAATTNTANSSSNKNGGTTRGDLYTFRSSQGLGPTVQDFQDLSPDTFATKVVWNEKLKKHGHGMAHKWASEEKAFKSVKAC